MEILRTVNDFLYSYLIIVALIGCGIYFTIRTKGVQFSQFKDSVRLLFKSDDGPVGEGEKHVSSFQAFAVSLASRLGTGDLAGVATAIVVGGPGSMFWMWVSALFGAATSFIETTLAQLYKRKGKDSFVGGPAYYIESGLGKRWMAILSAILIIIAFTFGFTLVQCNTIGSAFENQFGFNHVIVGVVLALLLILIISGGIQRVARVMSVIVPFMAMGFFLIAIVVVCMNIEQIPRVFKTVIDSAFGINQVAGGLMGTTIMQGVRRGLFSSEAGLGSTPNAAATAHVSHPVKQGLVQAFGVFIDTFVICSCTAFIILVSPVDLSGKQGLGIELTQAALTSQIGNWGSVFLTIALFFFAFSTVVSNCYYGEANLRFFTKKSWALTVFRIVVALMVFIGTCISLELAWEITDFCMGIACLLNLTALCILSPKVIKSLDDYRRQRKAGIKDPTCPPWWS